MKSSYETTAAFRQLMEVAASLDRSFLEGPRAVSDEASVLEGYKWIGSLLEVALDAYVWADRCRPRFVEIVGPYKKWGGDNSDAFYHYAPIDPSRTYRVQGQMGDAVYLSLTVYGGPDDGHYSERIVGSINDADLDIGPGGSFEIVLSPTPHDGAWIKLDPDAVCAITRDYLNDPRGGRRAQWRIECLDAPARFIQDDADLARRFRAATTWLVEQAQIAPVELGEPNRIEEPYPVPKQTFGWAAGDAAYAMGSFELEEDQALVITGRSPQCRFWNMCLWNPFLHTYNYDYERVTINGSQVLYEPDGSWKIVVAGKDPGHPNWVSTAGHHRGRIWFRWFLPATTPERPHTEVVSVDQLAPRGSSATPKRSE